MQEHHSSTSSSHIIKRLSTSEVANPLKKSKTSKHSDDGEKIVELDETLDYWHKKSEKFFEEISNKFHGYNPLLGSETINIVAVVHPVPTLPAFLKALQQIGHLKIIITKGHKESKKVDIATKDWLLKNFKTAIDECKTFVHLEYNGKETKEALKGDLEATLKLLTPVLEDDNKFIILDIGGYFAPHLYNLMQEEKFQDKIIGIVEDTENGHQSYEKALQNYKEQIAKISPTSDTHKLVSPINILAAKLEELKKHVTGYEAVETAWREVEKNLQALMPAPGLAIYPCPIFSVARAQVKRTEDYNVGKSIVEATNHMLRTEFNKYLENFKCIGVIGFGKIGSSIATHLRSMNVQKVMVFDIKPEMTMIAASQDFNVANKEKIKEKCDMIFCATGNKSLNTRDFSTLHRKKVFIASCTSPDSEFDIEEIKIPDPVKKEQKKPYSLYKYVSERKANKVPLKKRYNRVYLLAHGEAINFYYKAVVGPYIRSVQAAILVASLELIHTKKEEVKYAEEKPYELRQLLPETETKIAQIWLHNFHYIYEDSLQRFQPLPEKNLNFVAREKHIIQIKKLLNLSTPSYFLFHNFKGVIAIAGASGVGKTELIKEFIYQTFSEDRKRNSYYNFIHWLDFNSPSLYEQIVHLAEKIGVSPVGKTRPMLIDVIVERLKREMNYLLVIDGIESDPIDLKSSIELGIEKIPQIKQFLSLVTSHDLSEPEQGRKHIIISGRSVPSELSLSKEQTISVDKFDIHDAQKYVECYYHEYTINSKFSDASIVKLTGNNKTHLAMLSQYFNTLVLEKTVALVLYGELRDDKEIDEFVKNLANTSELVAGELDIEQNVKALTFIFSRLFIILNKIDKNLQKLIYSLIFLPEKMITREMLEHLCKSFDIKAEPTTSTCIQALEKFCILTLPAIRASESSKSDNFTLHKITREALIEHLDSSHHKEEKANYVENIIKILDGLFIYEYYGLCSHEKNSQYFSYLRNIFTKTNIHLALHSEHGLNLLFKYASYLLHALRDYGTAKMFFQKLIESSANLRMSLKIQTLKTRSEICTAICRNYISKSSETSKEILSAQIVFSNLNELKKLAEKFEGEEREIIDLAVIEGHITYSYSLKIESTTYKDDKEKCKSLISQANNELMIAEKLLTEVQKKKNKTYEVLEAALHHARAGIILCKSNFDGSINAAISHLKKSCRLRKEIFARDKNAFIKADLARSYYKLACLYFRAFTQKISTIKTPEKIKLKTHLIGDELLPYAKKYINEALDMQNSLYFNETNQDYEGTIKLKKAIEDALKPPCRQLKRSNTAPDFHKPTSAKEPKKSHSSSETIPLNLIPKDNSRNSVKRKVFD